MKNIQLSQLIGMGFNGASTFSGNRTGMQTRLQKQSSHAVFVHCHCHLLQLACVQAANATAGIKHVYITLTTLWKFSITLEVLDLPELIPPDRRFVVPSIVEATI